MSKLNLDTLQNKIDKKKNELKKANELLKTTEKKVKVLAEEVEQLEYKYLKETLDLNGMTFSDIRDLLEMRG